jgi:hypothetical protein
LVAALFTRCPLVFSGVPSFQQRRVHPPLSLCLSPPPQPRTISLSLPPALTAPLSLLSLLGIIRAEEVVGDFNSQNIANLIWACEALAIPPNRRLLEALTQRATTLGNLLIL